jgi:hypothetical protein
MLMIANSPGTIAGVFYGNAPECMKELARWKKHYSIEFSKAHFYTAKEKKAKE